MTERLAGTGIRDSAFEDPVRKKKKKRVKPLMPSPRRLLRQSEKRLHRTMNRMG